MNEKSIIDLLVENCARDAERHIKELKFLEGEIKTLIGAIRTAPDLESLRVVANDSVERLRKRSLETEKARIQRIAGSAAKERNLRCHTHESPVELRSDCQEARGCR